MARKKKDTKELEKMIIDDGHKKEPEPVAVTEQLLKDNNINTDTFTHVEEDKEVKLQDLGKFGQRMFAFFKAKTTKDSIIVNMELKNGDFRVFIVPTHDYGFAYKGGFYLFDYDMRYYIKSFSSYAMDFHQDYCLPVKRKVPVSQINQMIEAVQDSQVENATNPKVLHKFTISKMAEGVMQGQQMGETFKRIIIMLVIIMISSIISALLMLNQSGVLSSFKVW